jgi:hypothetical protein
MEISTDGWRQCNAAKFAEAESKARKIVPSDSNNCERADSEQPTDARRPNRRSNAEARVGLLQFSDY